MWASITVGHWTPQQPNSPPSHSSLPGSWVYVSRMEWDQWNLQASRINSPNQTSYNRQLFSLEVRHQNEAQGRSPTSILLETHIHILRLFLWVWTPNFFLMLSKKQRNPPFSTWNKPTTGETPDLALSVRNLEDEEVLECVYFGQTLQHTHKAEMRRHWRHFLQRIL